ncbi:WLM domain-containing protein [Biscogniauxia marginata]|nr:WLM domain-containing protein [Biscogniauxia marginata]
MSELDALIRSYSHLADFPRANEALHTLKKVASMVKPIMRARGFKVGELTEFYPNENLLGLNYDRGRKICLRLRYAGDRNQFLPIEEVTDTMLHELSHNVHGPHNDKFHALWNELRDEHEALIMKGYTGEGFLSKGYRLGGSRMPKAEARRLARVTAAAAAEKRRIRNAGSGQRLGGKAPRPDKDMRRVIADAVERRLRTLKGCANDNQTSEQIREIADTATRNGFKTQAEEDAANEAAIAQALLELIQEEEKAKKGDAYVPPSAYTPSESGSSSLVAEEPRNKQPAVRQSLQAPSRDVEIEDRDLPNTWTCNICTLANPSHFLCCDACGIERSAEVSRELAERSSKRQRTTIDLTKSDLETMRHGSSSAGPGRSMASFGAPTPVPRTWRCHSCSRIMDHKWWACEGCGSIKTES